MSCAWRSRALEQAGRVRGLGIRGGTQLLTFQVTQGSRAQDVFAFFTPVFDAVFAALAVGQSVLLHCRAGAHRAGTVSCATVMWFGRLSADAAIRSVKGSRDVVRVDGELRRLPLRLEGDIAAVLDNLPPEMRNRRFEPSSQPAASSSSAAPASASASSAPLLPRPRPCRRLQGPNNPLRIR